MNDHATKPLEENLQLIDPRSDPVSWNLNKALLEIAKQQQSMDRRMANIEHDLQRLQKAR